MAARKSRLYLNSFIPVNQTHDEVINNTFSSGKFGCTLTANLQLVGIVCLIFNLAISWISDYCFYHSVHRRLNIGSGLVAVCNAVALYIIFCCGYVVNNPNLWVRINIISNFLTSILTIVLQSMAINVCRQIKLIHKSPGPLGVVGGGCLLLSCFSLFILYRYKELDTQINAIIMERKISEEGMVTPQLNPSQTFSATSIENDRKRSCCENPRMHIKAQIYLKQEDKRKCSVHSFCEGIHSPRRKLSKPGGPDEHLTNVHHHNHNRGHYGHYSTRKMSLDMPHGRNHQAHSNRRTSCYTNNKQA